MSEIVTDSSVLVAILLREERWQKLDSMLGDSGCVVPGPLARYEVSNAVGKKRETPAELRQARMRRAWSTPLVEVPTEIWLSKAIEISTGFRSSFTDSCFIALAAVKQIPLLTLDKRQADTARAAGVAVELI